MTAGWMDHVKGNVGYGTLCGLPDSVLLTPKHPLDTTTSLLNLKGLELVLRPFRAQDAPRRLDLCHVRGSCHAPVW